MTALAAVPTPSAPEQAGNEADLLAELSALLPREPVPGAGVVGKGVSENMAKKAKRLCEVCELLACTLTAAGSDKLQISKETRLSLAKAAGELARQLVPLATAVADRAVGTKALGK